MNNNRDQKRRYINCELSKQGVPIKFSVIFTICGLQKKENEGDRKNIYTNEYCRISYMALANTIT